MRWFWIDRFIEFQSGISAKAIKAVSLSEEHLHDHFPGFPLMPSSLMIEGMAQTGGLLLGEVNQFKYPVVLAKVPKVEFFSWAIPGDTLTYSVRLTDAREEGGAVECEAHVGDRLVAKADIVYAHINSDTSASGIDQSDMSFAMNLLGVLEIGKAGTGDAADTPAE